MPQTTPVLRIMVSSPTGRMTFPLALTSARTSLEDHSPLRRWRTPRHYCASSCSSCHYTGIPSIRTWLLHVRSTDKETMSLLQGDVPLIGVPVYQWIVIHCCKKYLPNMLREWDWVCSAAWSKRSPLSPSKQQWQEVTATVLIITQLIHAFS